MTSNEVEQRGPAVPALMGGAGLTATGRAEVARVVAEEMAKVQLARTFPRDVDVAERRVRTSCVRWSFAKSAFYSYPRGRRWDAEANQWVPNIISGPSIRLAEELGTAWQNLEWSVTELDRDAERNVSTAKASCRDYEMNVTSSITWMIPLVTDKWEGPKGHRVKVKEVLEDERDKYERMANEGSRRVRSRIFNLLPAWYIDAAIDLCNETLAKGPPGPNGEVLPEPQRMTMAVDRFDATFGIRKAQLEQHVGASFPNWRTHDLARLTVLYETLVRGELRVDEVFPQPGADDAGEAAAPAERKRPPLMSGTRLEIDRLFSALGLGGKPNIGQRLAVAGVLAGDETDTPPVVPARWKDLDNDQGGAVLAGLRKILALPEDERPARLAELAEMARQAAGGADAIAGADGPPPGVPGLEEVLGELRGRFAGAGRYDPEHPEQHVDLILSVTSVLVHGHYVELADLGELTEDQARQAVTQFDALAANAARRDKTTADGLDLMYQAAVRQRAAAEQDDVPDGPADEPGE